MCFNCLKSFTDIEAYKNHTCGECTKKKLRKEKHKHKMVKELPHYIKPNFTKGSKEELAQYEGNAKAKADERILYPQYIVFNFKLIHIPIFINRIM